MRPRLLDLFCCSGGAAAGYHAAGFEVFGVDRVHRPRYPYTFILSDALDFLEHSMRTGWIDTVDLIHASPPCQEGCALTIGTNRSRGWGSEDHVQLIPELRHLLEATLRPYVIEQPTGNAPVRRDITLCGEQFGLGVIRHRHFELGGWTTLQPPHVKHRGRVRGMRHGQWFDGPYVAAYGNGGGKATVAEMQQAMGITWTDVREELTEAIPPAYTEWLGRAYLDTKKPASVAAGGLYISGAS